MNSKICVCCGEPIEESTKSNPNICGTCEGMDFDQESGVVVSNHEVDQSVVPFPNTFVNAEAA